MVGGLPNTDTSCSKSLAGDLYLENLFTTKMELEMTTGQKTLNYGLVLCGLGSEQQMLNVQIAMFLTGKTGTKLRQQKKTPQSTRDQGVNFTSAQTTVGA